MTLRMRPEAAEIRFALGAVFCMFRIRYSALPRLVKNTALQNGYLRFAFGNFPKSEHSPADGKALPGRLRVQTRMSFDNRRPTLL